MRTFLALCIVTILLTVSCSRKTDFGETIPSAASTIGVKEARDLRNRGRTVYVRGTIREVCKDEGCWFSVSDGAQEIVARYEENGIGIPIISSGDVIVKGIVRDTLIARTYVPELRATGVKFVTSQP